MLDQFTLTTSMGSLNKHLSSLQNILTEEEVAELDVIGFTGKTSKGEKSSFANYLNSLGKGEFSIKQVGWDNGSFTEKYEVARYLPNKK